MNQWKLLTKIFLKCYLQCILYKGFYFLKTIDLYVLSPGIAFILTVKNLAKNTLNYVFHCGLCVQKSEVWVWLWYVQFSGKARKCQPACILGCQGQLRVLCRVLFGIWRDCDYVLSPYKAVEMLAAFMAGVFEELDPTQPHKAFCPHTTCFQMVTCTFWAVVLKLS